MSQRRSFCAAISLRAVADLNVQRIEYNVIVFHSDLIIAGFLGTEVLHSSIALASRHVAVTGIDYGAVGNSDEFMRNRRRLEIDIDGRP